MNSRVYSIILLLVFLTISPFARSSDSTTIVYTFHIDEMIAPPVWRTTKLAIENAHKTNADIILIEMNTYGGMLDAADSIRTKIMDCDIPVYVFIDKNIQAS